MDVEQRNKTRKEVPEAVVLRTAYLCTASGEIYELYAISIQKSKRRKMDAEWRNRTRREVPEAVPSVRRVVLFVHCAPFFKFT